MNSKRQILRTHFFILCIPFEGFSDFESSAQLYRDSSAVIQALLSGSDQRQPIVSWLEDVIWEPSHPQFT